MMPEIESTFSYWNEFFRTHPDHTELETLTSSHPSLVKIFNFSAVPWIWPGIKNYPFKEKVEELKSISKADIDYLDRKRFQEGGNQEWFDYLGNLFDMVRSTVKLKIAFDEANRRHGGACSKEQVLEKVDEAFKRAFSVDQIVVYKEENGIKVTVRRHGRFFPVRWVKIILRENVLTGSREWVGQEHFIFPPMEEEIQRAISGWDRFSVRNIWKYGREVDEVSFKGPEGFTHKVELYYKGNLLEKPFVFPIVKRYFPLLGDKIKKARQRAEAISGDANFLGTEEELLSYAEGKLFEKAIRYDESSPVDPAGYFEGTFEHFANEILEDISTEAIKIECDEFCRARKEQEKSLPCEFETDLGYCADPKRKGIIKPDLSLSTKRLDEPDQAKIYGDKEERTSLIETFNKDGDPRLEENQLVERITLEKIYKNNPKLARIMKREKDGIALSSSERNFKKRTIEKLKKNHRKN